jgi:diguanylate cyclase (GGDEF)-like protein
MRDAAATEAERVASESAASLDQLLDARSAQINHKSLAQIHVGNTVRGYVAVALVLAMALLATVFGLYRAALARERRAMARIERMAHFDAVTGLPNRALLADRLAQEVARAHRSEQPFAVLALDLDGFKAVNDTWGHPAGDQALQLVAERCRKLMRASDTVGRLGGDEFLALLPETTTEGALNAAEKLRESLAEPYVIGSALARMSASIGIAVFPAHGSDAEALQRAADAALYEAKREGKNRVKVGTRAPARAAA